MYKRIVNLDYLDKESCFFWGPRQTGKSTLLKQRYPEAVKYDLLLASEFRRLHANPDILIQELSAVPGKILEKHPIIIDEVQKVPELLDVVHWLIENRGIRFILAGSSARKLKRGQANLLGGRALRYELFPLVYAEIDDFSLETALNRGLLPKIYQSSTAKRLLQAYVDDYLKEEIYAESLVRSLPDFSRFLELAGLTNGKMVVYENIACDIGVSAPTIKAYFQILLDTMLGSYLPSFRGKGKRRTVSANKFYIFDLGVAASLSKRGDLQIGSEAFGDAFEHFIYEQLRAHSSYSQKCYPISYWRTSSGAEVDFIVGNAEYAIEVKATEKANDKHLKNLRAFKEEFSSRRYILVSQDKRARKTQDGIEIMPWKGFLNSLWSDELIV